MTVDTAVGLALPLMFFVMMALEPMIGSGRDRL
jgi:hypothetical protein